VATRSLSWDDDVLVSGMVTRLCRIVANPPCEWDPHNYKHFPFPGMTREHTRRPNPARYLPGFDIVRIQTLETETARRRELQRGSTSAKTEYLRDIGEAVGWDQGEDASLSFVECAGGEVARSFHGRPMCAENSKVRGDWES
jgi:hypothetical protein